MLRECPDHGYFRGETCPMCDQSGRFLMSTEELDRLGRIMAGVLRHFPQRFGLRMNAHGYVDINDIVREVKKRRHQFHWLRAHHIRSIAITDPKGRYQIVGTKVRATYGHSIEVDLDLPEEDIPDFLYYPTNQEGLEKLMGSGITPSDRRDVHLSATAKDAYVAGSFRMEAPLILKVDANECMEDGIIIQKAGTTVYLTKDVPPKYLELIEFDKSELEEDEDDTEEEFVGEAPMTEEAAEEPEAVEPDAVGPEAVEPEAVKPEAVEPEAVKPEAVKPKAVKPEAVEPEALKPEAVKPEAVKPEAVKPEALKPEAVKPEAVEPDAVKPKAVEAEAVKPKAVKPEAVKPEAVKPEAVKPKAVEAEAVEPPED